MSSKSKSGSTSLPAADERRRQVLGSRRHESIQPLDATRVEPAASPARRWQGPVLVACRAKGLARSHWWLALLELAANDRKTLTIAVKINRSI